MRRKVIEATSAVPAVAGFIQQIGPPAEVYAFPAATFVGGFVGSPPMNFLSCRSRTDAFGSAR
jgi:ABC-type sugar transport system ATPase subunit